MEMKGTVDSFILLSVGLTILTIIVLKMYIFRNRMEWTGKDWWSLQGVS